MSYVVDLIKGSPPPFPLMACVVRLDVEKALAVGYEELDHLPRIRPEDAPGVTWWAWVTLHGWVAEPSKIKACVPGAAGHIILDAGGGKELRLDGPVRVFAFKCERDDTRPHSEGSWYDKRPLPSSRPFLELLQIPAAAWGELPTGS